MTLLIAGKLILEDREGLCRVRNISATGMMIETRALLQVDQLVRVAMRHGGEIGARVVWTRDCMAGLAFPAPLDVEAALAPQLAQSRLSRTRAPRAPRVATHSAIEVEARGVLYPAALPDISQSGARLLLPFRPLQDERLVLSIPGLPLKSGVVRWLRDEEAGVSFFEPLPFDTLAEWVEAYGHQAAPCDQVPTHSAARRISL